MNRFFKLHKFLFEDDRYKDIGLNSKVALSLERCKNDIRNNEYVINKLIKYIELKIEDENYWNQYKNKVSQKL